MCWFTCLNETESPLSSFTLTSRNIITMMMVLKRFTNSWSCNVINELAKKKTLLGGLFSYYYCSYVTDIEWLCSKCQLIKIIITPGRGKNQARWPAAPATTSSLTLIPLLPQQSGVVARRDTQKGIIVISLSSHAELSLAGSITKDLYNIT